VKVFVTFCPLMRYTYAWRRGLEVRFRTKQLEDCYLQSAKAARAFGPEVGRRYIGRINLIKAAPDLDTLKNLPGLRCHPLHGDRKGQWAATLIDRVRLIFTFSDGAMTIVRIEEVSKHYDD
jgi:proteic killer suppression protein